MDERSAPKPWELEEHERVILANAYLGAASGEVLVYELYGAVEHILKHRWKAKVIADATDAIDYFEENPQAWAYVRATNPDLVARLRQALEPKIGLS